MPDSLVGLILFSASLGPGYVYLRVAERRHSRAERSALFETVEMVVIGGALSTISAMLVLFGGDALGALDASRLGRNATPYFFDHPVRLLGSLLAVLGLSYGGAYAAARVTHRGTKAAVRPGRTTWDHTFRHSRPTDDLVVLASLQLRDGRRVMGKMSNFTVGHAENREVALVAPLFSQESPAADVQQLDGGFIVFREADVLAIAGRWGDPGTA